jgi:hypothetical protein
MTPTAGDPADPRTGTEPASGPPLDAGKRAPWPIVAWRIVLRLAYYGFVIWLGWRAIPAFILLLILCPVLLIEWSANRKRKRGGYTPG